MRELSVVVAQVGRLSATEVFECYDRSSKLEFALQCSESAEGSRVLERQFVQR